MELYVVDDMYFEPQTLVDGYTSLVWTERYNAYGDFTLELAPTYSRFEQLKPGTYLRMSESSYVMEVKNVSIREDRSDTPDTMIVTGESLESFFKDRFPSFHGFPGIAKNALDVTFERAFDLGFTVDGANNNENTMRMTYEDPEDLMQYLPTSMRLIGPELTVYDILRYVCTENGVGFYIDIIPDMAFPWEAHYVTKTYGLVDSYKPELVFSPEVGTLGELEYIYSREEYYNVVYVGQGSTKYPLFYDRYLRGGSPIPYGFKRRALYIPGSQVGGDQVEETRDQMAARLLNEHEELKYIDGVVPSYGPYKYGVDYRLGDLVTVSGKYGFEQEMYVVEYIHISDNEGQRGYPTLSDKPMNT